jgi:hypothetical protein
VPARVVVPAAVAASHVCRGHAAQSGREDRARVRARRPMSAIADIGADTGARTELSTFLQLTILFVNKF